MQEMRLSLIPRSGRSPRGGHGNSLPQKNSWTEEPGGLQSMGSQRVRKTTGRLKACDIWSKTDLYFNPDSSNDWLYELGQYFFCFVLSFPIIQIMHLLHILKFSHGFCMLYSVFSFFFSFIFQFYEFC